MKFLILACSFVAFLSGCTFVKQSVPELKISRVFADEDKNDPKHFQIFFDGTSNDYLARTNVRRRFEMLAMAEDPHYPCLYVEGVGVHTLAGKAFGTGMKDRVVAAYCYLAQHWSSEHKDTLKVYGFSRGAFQARMFTGLLAHCGLPDARTHSEKDLKKLANRIWDYCEKELTEPSLDPDQSAESRSAIWKKHLENNHKLVVSLANSDASAKRNPWKFSNPDVLLLGIWDTVPGLPLDHIVDDSTIINRKKQPFKISPYPNIKHVVHALALDEKRSQFHPLRIGSPISKKTKVYEVWFPGVHSDIGGGYESNDMAGISLAWMQKIMEKEKLIGFPHTFYSDSHGILHHPENIFFNSIGSKKVSRQLRFGDHVDYSVFLRADGKEHPEKISDSATELKKYAPEFSVIQESGPPKTLRLDQGPYNKKSALAALKSVGLDLYDIEGKLDNGPDQTPLSLKEMDIQVTSTSTTVAPATAETIKQAPKKAVH